jgi:hypothetical protein
VGHIRVRVEVVHDTMFIGEAWIIDIWFNRLMTGLTRDSVAHVSGASQSKNSKNMRNARQFGRLLESVDDVYQKTNCSCQLKRSRHISTSTVIRSGT